MKPIYFEPIDKRKPNFKKGDKVICINAIGHKENLTKNKEYEIIKFYRQYSADHVIISGDNGTIEVFSTRFSTLKLQRKEKLDKLLELQ